MQGLIKVLKVLLPNQLWDTLPGMNLILILGGTEFFGQPVPPANMGLPSPNARAHASAILLMFRGCMALPPYTERILGCD